jgi:hypothetical protein
MTVHGTVVKGQVVLDEPGALPDGTRVQVTAEKREGPTIQGKPTLLSLLKLVATAKDLPADFSAQHDHYLHGTPKR